MILSSVLQQPAGVDYGVFVIAFAVNILNGFAETRKRFDVGKIRSHPLKCLEEEEFTLFLRIHKHTKLSKRYGFYIDIYYVFRSPFYEENNERDESLFMAECAKCGEWYHKKFPGLFLGIKVSSGNVWDVRNQYSGWNRKNKKIFYFST